MFWALASSVLVIYLYRTLNAPAAAVPEPGALAEASAASIDAALDALDARIAALEAKLGASGEGGPRP